MTIAEIADVIFTAPGITHGFLQQNESMWPCRVGGVSFNQKQDKRERRFRCCLSDGKKVVEGAHEHVEHAVCSAFEQLGLPLPAALLSPDDVPIPVSNA